MSQTLTTGLECPLKPLNKECRQEDVDKALAFGNHKGASLQPKVLQQLVLKDIHFGYCLLLPLAKVRKIPVILLTLMNIKKQNSINKLGWIVEKDRLIHDQSFEWLSGTSVNNRVRTDKLLLCMFGACIKQIVNWAVNACRLFPNVPILMSKIDFKSTFQQCHLNAATAVQTCTQLIKIDILVMML
jgi:hypothetical protein